MLPKKARKKLLNKEIVFYKILDILDEYKPEPAKKFIPEWYRRTENYMGNEKKPNGNAQTSATIKKCMPVFDAITAGYIITTYADIFVSRQTIQINSGETITSPWYEWPSIESIQFHPIEQAPLHPDNQNSPYPKFMNPWGMKTPKGYSVLFIPPMHRKTPFNILPGIVDTDTYVPPVNFPFVLSDPNFEGMIPAGTPVAQIIPFKRESWLSSVSTKEIFNQIIDVNKKLSSHFFDKYKSFFWHRKDYR
jgi:hypothetical protein